MRYEIVLELHPWLNRVYVCLYIYLYDRQLINFDDDLLTLLRLASSAKYLISGIK